MWGWVGGWRVEAGKRRRVNEVSITDIPRQKIDRPQTEILAIWSCATGVVCLLFLFLSAWFLYRICMVFLQNLHGFSTESAWFLYRICMVSLQNLNGFSTESSWLYCRICMVSLQNLHGFTTESAWFLYRICMVLLQNLHERSTLK